jgi:hypothetical protein
MTYIDAFVCNYKGKSHIAEIEIHY